MQHYKAVGCCVKKIFSAEQESQSHQLQPAVWVLHIFFCNSLLASLFCCVRVKALTSAFQVLCIALPYFTTVLPSQDASVPVHLPHTPAITPPISSMVIPELPGVEYFYYLILEVQFLFYMCCWKDCPHYLETFFPINKSFIISL